MTKHSVTLIASCALVLGAVWYFTRSTPIDTKKEKERLKDFIRKYHPYAQQLSAKVTLEVLPRYSRCTEEALSQLSQARFELFIAASMKKIEEEMGLEDAMEHFRNTIGDDPEYESIMGEFFNMHGCALLGKYVCAPFAQIHKDLNHDKMYEICEEIKMRKLENVNDMWNKLELKCGSVRVNPNKNREVLTLSQEGFEVLSLLSTDAENSVIEKYAEFFPAGYESFSQVRRTYMNDKDFNAAMNELETRQMKLMEKAFDDLIQKYKDLSSQKKANEAPEKNADSEWEDAEGVDDSNTSKELLETPEKERDESHSEGGSIPDYIHQNHETEEFSEVKIDENNEIS